MPLGKKKCFGCNMTKEIFLFSKSKYDKTGFCSQCKECSKKRGQEWRKNNKEKSKQTLVRWRNKNRDHLRDKKYKLYYGIGLDEFNRIFESQNKRCVICNELMIIGRAKNSAHLDHDHQDGKIRGILCLMCNHGLGNFKDNQKLLKKAITYLKKYA